MSENEKLVADFLSGIGSDRKPVPTNAIDNIPVKDGWMQAFYDSDRGIGWTVVAYDSQNKSGNFLCRVDLTKDTLGAEGAGKLAAKIFNP